MQYILSEEEYRELKKKQSIQIQMDKKKLQELCTKIANTTPVFYWGREEASIWGCIHNEHRELDDYNDVICEEDVPKGVPIQTTSGYCDECPVLDICPENNKRFSK